MLKHLLAPKFIVPALIIGAAAALTAADAAKKSLGYEATSPLIPGTKWHVHDGTRPAPPVVTPAATFSHLAPPPSDATVLFDGKDLSKWAGPKGEAGWKIEDGFMEVAPKSGSIRTKDSFADFQLHLEFATPAKVDGNSQGRGNSGVFLMGIYELQILDSYENPTYVNGQAAAIYKQAFLEGLLPPAAMTVSEWADQHRILSGKGSAEKGPWRTMRTPYLKEPMDCLSHGNPTRRVVLMFGSQMGKTNRFPPFPALGEFSRTRWVGVHPLPSTEAGG